MTQDPQFEKIVETKTFVQDMFINMPDGTKVPTKGKVTETYYESGRKDTHVEVEKPLAAFGQTKQ